MVGIAFGIGMKVVVYVRGKNAKKYRHGAEYGTARWGTAQGIEPYMASNFKDNTILIQTERLMMNSLLKKPKYARNKNVLVPVVLDQVRPGFFCFRIWAYFIIWRFLYEVDLSIDCRSVRNHLGSGDENV